MDCQVVRCESSMPTADIASVSLTLAANDVPTHITTALSTTYTSLILIETLQLTKMGTFSRNLRRGITPCHSGV